MKALYWCIAMYLGASSHAAFAQCTTGDCENGTGRYVYASGDRYIGEFKDGKRHGRGVYHYVNGSIYQGQFDQDRRHGYGTYRWTNGDSFIGEYREDLRHGEGTYYFADGRIEEGVWDNGQMIRLKKPTPVVVNNTDPFAISGDTTGTNNMASMLKAISNTVEGQPRLALVIGNSKYPSVPLKNPVNDAVAIAQELQRSGFDVMLFTDVGEKDMKIAIRDFGNRLKEKKGVGLFYYAGHGLQIDGRNYILPVDADVQKIQDVEFESVDLSRILVEMEYAENEMNIVILDACRDNPYKEQFKATGRSAVGLASINSAPPNSLIAFSTAPGATAYDGDGANGLYTQEFLKALQTEGLKIEEVFKKVRSQVRLQSDGEQIPWETSSIENDFYFKKK